MDKEILNVNNICIGFNKHMVLKNLSVFFNRGETVLIAGRNGSGKTTFMLRSSEVNFYPLEILYW